MKLGIVMVGCMLIMAGCSAEVASPTTTSMYGNWALTNSSESSGVGLTLNENGEYALIIMRLTSDRTAEAALETGNFSVSSSEFTFVPKKSTCPNSSEKETVQYTQTNNKLNLLFSTGFISLEKNESTADTGFVVTFGCFQEGKFTKSPLVSLNTVK